jgi:WD40 repeat protein
MVFVGVLVADKRVSAIEWLIRHKRQVMGHEKVRMKEKTDRQSSTEQMSLKYFYFLFSSTKSSLYDLIGHEDKVLCVDWSIKNLILTGSSDNTFKMYKAS